jgi:hypothetical protein
VYFDFEAGWVTPQENVHQNNTLETVVGIVFVAAASYISFNTLGPWAAGLVQGATGSAVMGGLAGVAAVGAAGGAASAFVGGAMSGNLALRDLLRGALSGALSATLTSGLVDAGWIGQPGSVSNVLGRMTVQGGINALMGGSFREGAAAGFASALADAVAVNLNRGIASLPPSEAAAGRHAVRIIASAIRALGNPNDPLHAFASGLTSDVLGAIAPAPGTGTPNVPAAPPPTSTAFDDDGNLMPGVVDMAASFEAQREQLAARLLEQGFSAGDAAGMAAEHFDLTMTLRDQRTAILAARADGNDARGWVEGFEPGSSDTPVLVADGGSGIDPTRRARLESRLLDLANAPTLADVERNAAFIDAQIGKFNRLEAEARTHGDFRLAEAIGTERAMFADTHESGHTVLLEPVQSRD